MDIVKNLSGFRDRYLRQKTASDILKIRSANARVRQRPQINPLTEIQLKKNAKKRIDLLLQTVPKKA